MTKKTKKKILISFSLVTIITIIAHLIFVDNKTIIYEDFNFSFSEEIGKKEIKIIHLSDLHFPKIKVNLKEMYREIIDQNPNLIAITGDLIDRNSDVQECGVFQFIDEIIKIAPVFYVNGNHEDSNIQTALLYQKLDNVGVHRLVNRAISFPVEDGEISILGLKQDCKFSDSYFENQENIETNIKILLAHRPEEEMFNSYVSNDNKITPHLILAGHAHGGQYRLFNQGILAPSQGLFPKYESGAYTKNNATMIVSRGIGNSLYPLRFNNKPHIPVITINY